MSVLKEQMGLRGLRTIDGTYIDVIKESSSDVMYLRIGKVPGPFTKVDLDANDTELLISTLELFLKES